VFTKSLLTLFALILITGCSTRGVKHHSKTTSSSKPKKTYTSNDPNYVHPTMRPYSVFGKRYYPTKVRVGEKFTGISSWYGPNFNGKATSNGEIYNMHALTAAHKTLPMNTKLRVTNLENGKSVIVRINDRGPFVGDRIIDLSNKAAHQIDMVKKGTARVRLEIISLENTSVAKSHQARRATKTSKPPNEVLESSSYALQIGSFGQIEGAVATQEKYDGYSGYKTIIKDSEYNDKRVFRVWLSGFKSEAEARDFKANSEFKNAFIVGE